jgi:hypothetical protein
MGLRSWWRRFKQRCVEIYNKYVHSDRYQAKAYFDDGFVAVYRGPPRGDAFDKWSDFIS